MKNASNTPAVEPLDNEVKLGQFPITYPEVTETQIEAAGLTRKLFVYGIGKLRAHKLNTLVWDEFARVITGQVDQGAVVRKQITTAKIDPKVQGAEYDAAVASAIKSTPEKVRAAHEAMSAFALTADHVAALKAERVSRKQLDPDAAQAAAILTDPTAAQFGALQKFAKANGLSKKIEPVIDQVRVALLMLRTFGTPFEA